MKFEYLSWDSHFFGLKVGKVSVDTKINDLTELNALDCDILYVFSKNKQSALEAHGFHVLDSKVNFHKKSNAFYFNEVPDIISYNGPMTDELLQLALESGWKSRFKVDTHLTHKFDELYTLWLQRSLNREIANDFFVAMDKDVIVGFVTVSEHGESGKIGLIAVDAGYRGKGIGSKLIKKAEHWYSEHHLHTADVVTQLENEMACTLYERNGYAISSIDYIYHYKK